MTPENPKRNNRPPLLSHEDLRERLELFLSRQHLPGLTDSIARERFVDELWKSQCNVHLKLSIASGQLSPAPNELRVLQRIVELFRLGQRDEAVWLTFLCIHFGEDVPDSTELFYTQGGKGHWSWKKVCSDSGSIRRWISANSEHLNVLKFGNHRTHRKNTPGDPKGTPAVIQSFVQWVGKKGSPYGVLRSLADATCSREEAFDSIYESLKVTEFGRLAKFDFLCLLGNLGILEVTPGHCYLKNATGPRRGALLLVTGDREGKFTDHVDRTIRELTRHLQFPVQVMEDALCNWQKNKRKNDSGIIPLAQLVNRGSSACWGMHPFQNPILSPFLAILGIDAAWSARHPSGVALVAQDQAGWQCIALAPSYTEFSALATGERVNWQARRNGTSPKPAILLRAAGRMLRSQRITVVALDIPLSTVPIKGRRAADNLLSAEYGNKGCSAHSPTRPELHKISKRLGDGFMNEGFPLVVEPTGAARHSLIEVFPHPALLALLRENYRVPYKVNRARLYWPKCSPLERKENLLRQYRRILGALRQEISGIPIALPESAEGLHSVELKAYEDSLDALLCAWVGMKYLKGEARAFGDKTAAIWVAI